jgi:hypothetical protein
MTHGCNIASEAVVGLLRWGKVSYGLRALEKSLGRRYAICSRISLVKPATCQSSYESAAAAQRMRDDGIEPGSIMLFVLLLSAFIAILTLRAHLLGRVDRSAAMVAPPTPALALVAKGSSLGPTF